jgi:hypothetical protein
MVTMPDGVQLEMKWKYASYIQGDIKLIFSIIPMLYGKDILVVPNKEQWVKISHLIDLAERDEIIFLLERIAWNRLFRIAEMNVTPILLNKDDIYITDGSLESTQAGVKIESLNLFDPNQSITKDQAKQLYVHLEEKFANQASGKVEIYRSLVLNDSVLEKITLPILRSNPNIQLSIID